MDNDLLLHVALRIERKVSEISKSTQKKMKQNEGPRGFRNFEANLEEDVY